MKCELYGIKVYSVWGRKELNMWEGLIFSK